VIQPGCIYTAPSVQHLLIQDSRVRLLRGPKENRFRPAIDPLFRTAARAYKGRVVGVILSGSLDDGVAGLTVVKAYGGTAIAQDLEEALFGDIPRNAVENVKVDYVLPLAEIAPMLVRLVHEPVFEEEVGLMPKEADILENELVQQNKAFLERNGRSGEPTVITCPDCGGVLWEIDEGELVRFRCHVGHAYSVESLMAGQTDALELALWTAVRALEEKASLARRMATRMRKTNSELTAARFEGQARDAEERADPVRQVLSGNNPLASPEPDAVDEAQTGEGDAG
jgi:two-component system chemotaxis response regulator CheB